MTIGELLKEYRQKKLNSKTICGWYCKYFLSFEERVVIRTRLKDGYSIRAIARELGCSPSTISYEVKRGTVSLYHGKQQRYKAEHGQSVYQESKLY